MREYMQRQHKICTENTLTLGTDMSQQKMQIQMGLLLKEQSDQGLHCLLFYLHSFRRIPGLKAELFKF